jgi:hypothetical protein
VACEIMRHNKGIVKKFFHETMGNLRLQENVGKNYKKFMILYFIFAIHVFTFF